MSLFWMVTSSTHHYANVTGVSAKPLYESVVWVSDYKSQAIIGVIIYPYSNLKLFFNIRRPVFRPLWYVLFDLCGDQSVNGAIARY